MLAIASKSEYNKEKGGNTMANTCLLYTSPGISGSLVEGRVCYDAFILENKKKAIYYQAVK